MDMEPCQNAIGYAFGRQTKAVCETNALYGISATLTCADTDDVFNG